MKTILITAIGGDIAQGVASIIREARPEYRIIGTDIHKRHGGTLYVDAFYLIPAASNPSYSESIYQIIESESVDIVMPISEPELGVWINTPNRLENVKWIMPGNKVIHVGLDKLETANALAELGLEVPWTQASEKGMPKELPCIFKGRTGSGSRNIFVVYDEHDAQYLRNRYSESIFQELLEPEEQEVTCAVFRASNGEISIFQMRRKLAGGLTDWVETINNRDVRAMCEKIAKGLGLCGSMNIQLRITAVGPRVFEINPRFSSTAVIRHRLGFTDVVWSLDDVEGREIEFPMLEAGKTAVRTKDAVVLD